MGRVLPTKERVLDKVQTYKRIPAHYHLLQAHNICVFSHLRPRGVNFESGVFHALVVSYDLKALF